MSADRELILAAARLARSAPEGWKQFLGAFQMYTNSQRDNCVQSPLDILPVTQGRAQCAAQLLGLFADCLSKADAIEGKRK
jgi:hypothetical protein